MPAPRPSKTPRERRSRSPYPARADDVRTFRSPASLCKGEKRESRRSPPHTRRSGSVLLVHSEDESGGARDAFPDLPTRLAGARPPLARNAVERSGSGCLTSSRVAAPTWRGGVPTASRAPADPQSQTDGPGPKSAPQRAHSRRPSHQRSAAYSLRARWAHSRRPPWLPARECCVPFAPAFLPPRRAATPAVRASQRRQDADLLAGWGTRRPRLSAPRSISP